MVARRKKEILMIMNKVAKPISRNLWNGVRLERSGILKNDGSPAPKGGLVGCW